MAKGSERDDERGMREKRRGGHGLTVWQTTVELTSEIIRRDETGRAH